MRLNYSILFSSFLERNENESNFLPVSFSIISQSSCSFYFSHSLSFSFSLFFLSLSLILFTSSTITVTTHIGWNFTLFPTIFTNLPFHSLSVFTVLDVTCISGSSCSDALGHFVMYHSSYELCKSNPRKRRR